MEFLGLEKDGLPPKAEIQRRLERVKHNLNNCRKLLHEYQHIVNTRWIPVSKRLPDVVDSGVKDFQRWFSLSVLVSVEARMPNNEICSYVRIGRLSGDTEDNVAWVKCGAASATPLAKNEKVVAWMPMPEPYNG